MKVACAGVLRLCCHIRVLGWCPDKSRPEGDVGAVLAAFRVAPCSRCFFSLQVPTDGFSEEMTVSETTGSFHEWLRCYLHPFHSQKHVSSCQHASSNAEEALLLLLKERSVVGKIRLFPLKVMFCLFTPEFFWWCDTGESFIHRRAAPSVAGRRLRWCFLFLLLWFHTTGGWINGVFTNSDICIDTRVRVSDQRWVTREESGTELNWTTDTQSFLMCPLCCNPSFSSLFYSNIFFSPHSSNVPFWDGLGVGEGVPCGVWMFPPLCGLSRRLSLTGLKICKLEFYYDEKFSEQTCGDYICRAQVILFQSAHERAAWF